MRREAILAGESRYLAGLNALGQEAESRLFSGELSVTALNRGYLLPDELADIARWRWPDEATRVQAANSNEVVRRFTAAAIAHRDDPRLATWVLTYLHGVHVRMASAVLAVLFPDEYAVMDSRTWSGLEAVGWTPDLGQVFGDQLASPDFLDRCSVYEIYLDVIREKSAKLGVTLRALERFLRDQGVAPDDSTA